MTTTSAAAAVSSVTRASHATWVRWFCALVVFPLLIAVGAQVRIPMPGTLVPFTLQTLFVFLAGGLLGAPASLAACGMYLLLGCLQVPVFAGRITGFAYLLGPTGGYLLGFLITAPLVAALLRRYRPQRVSTYALWIALGSLPILACGALVYGLSLGLDARAVWVQAVLPFLAGDALKAMLAAGVLRVARPRESQLA
jgi:biotin transport system substrate-specific component